MDIDTGAATRQAEGFEADRPSAGRGDESERRDSPARVRARPPRTLLIGLDACDEETALRLAASGDMPILRGLLEKAARCPLRLPPALFVSGLWASFSTGLRPDRHKFLCWDEIEISSYRRRLTTPRRIAGIPFWRRLAAAGLGTVSIDVPHTLVREDGEPAATNELEIAEWGCHDRHVGLQVWPPEERSRLEREFGPHPVFGMAAPAARSFAPDDYIHRAGARRRPEEDRRLTEGLLSGIALKERLSRKYLAARDWDLFLTVFGEAHAVGHQQWHLHDTAHPDFDAAAQQAIGGDPVARVYAGLDAALGRLLAAVDERTTVLVMLSHGMGPHHDGTHLLDEVLRRIDRADRASEGESWREAGWRRLGDLQGLLGKTVRRLRGGPPREFVSAGERARQRFFLAPNNYVYGGIRLNMCGREPRGRVAPEDIGRVIAGLERDLKALVNLATGAPVIRGIERAGRWYRRSNDDTMPDLFIDWERSAPIETVWSQKTGRVHAPYVNWRTGDHRPRGLLLAVGPGIEAGSALPEMAIEDLPASLAVRFGVAHDDMDGRPADWLRG